MLKKMKYIIIVLILELSIFPYKISAAYKVAKCGDSNNGLRGRYAVPYQIPNLTSLAVIIMEIAIPVIIVILGSIDLIKAMTAGKEDEIKKSQRTFVKRLIIGAIVFFIFALTKLLVSIVNTNSSGIIDCMDCFINGKCEF